MTTNLKDSLSQLSEYLVTMRRRRSKNTGLMGFALLLLLSFFGSFNGIAQTVLINPASEGGFENGASFAANGWTVANSVNNPWLVGALSNGAITGNAAFISNDGSTPSYNVSSTCTNYFYRDITIPAGQSKIKLDFNWLCGGESTYDLWQVFVAPTSITPVGGIFAGQGASNVPAAIAGATFVGNGNLQAASVQTSTFFLPPSLAGTTFRLIFVWKSDTSAGVQPPAQIDNISLVSSVAGNYTSIASGDWSSPSTWDLGTAPSTVDNATVSAGHSVTINALNQGINNLSVNGVLAYSTVSTSFGVVGNLTVGTNGLINVFEGTTGKTLLVAGNITNNGVINVSVGATTAGTLTLNGSAVQAVSGAGSFASDAIRNLIFSNTNAATPNINWSLNNVKIIYNLNLTDARINLGTNKMTFGNNAAGNTLTAPIGSGFLPGAKFSRFWNATVTGTAITAGADPTGTTSRYPFITASGVNRAMYISRTNATGAVAGELAVVYNDANTVTSNLDIPDGTYPITDRFNGNWSVSNEFSAIASSSYKIALFAPNGLVPMNGNTRIMSATSAMGGSHQNGTVTPSAQRIDVSQTDLLAGPLYMGINVDDVPYLSVVSGNWSTGSTWNKGFSPSCGDAVAIGTGTIVTSNSAGNNCKSVTVVPGGTLLISSGDLVIGCTLKNNSLVNNGTLTVSGGTLNINGNLISNSGSTLNQSGGEIIIDGNDGVIANSVVTGTPLFRVNATAANNLNLAGGSIKILNPHRGTSTADTAFSISQGGTANAAGINHTLYFGDGSSDISAGSTSGFFMNLFAGAQYYTLGNLVVDVATGTNRYLKTSGNIGIRGNLTINSGEYQMLTSTFVGGDIINNGTLSSTGLLAMGTFVPPSSIAPSTIPQSISGTGTFRNSLTVASADLTNFQVSNSSVSGVTLNVPLSVSGTLSTTSGYITTSNTNLLTLGTATTPGILAGEPNATTYIKGPFVRTIGSGNLATNYILFPVGKSIYAPVSLAPTTTAISLMRAEAFDGNTGTAAAGVTNLSSTRRWATSLDLGAFTNTKVRLGGAFIASGNIPVQAPTASGVYTSSFGSTAAFTAGTPNSIQSDGSVIALDFTGFLSIAESNACVGTPAPGNTIASPASICVGESVNLSLQNLTAGSGITYQWKSSLDGIVYLPIPGATGASLSLSPTVSSFYLCDVNCTATATTTSSTAVQVGFANNVLSTTPASRCGVGTLSLVATSNTGSTLNWFSGASGGTAIATGSPFITPSLNASTDYYVEASTSQGFAAVGPVSPTTQGGAIGTQTVDWNVNFTVNQATQLSSVDVFPITSGQNAVIALRSSTGTVITTVNYTTAVSGGSTAQSVLLNFPLTPGSYQLYTTLPSGGLSRNTTGAIYPYTSSVASITGNGFDPLYFMGLYNWKFGTNCVSPRVKVTATVTTAPIVTLSANAVTICRNSVSTPVTLTSSATDFDTFIWSPIENVSGNNISGWVFNPTVNTIYTLTASQSTGSLCAAIATVSVSVSPIPTPIIFLPNPANVCLDEIQSLSVSGGTLGVSGKIGAGILENTNSTPFKGYWGGSKTQALYTAAELTALGLQTGQSISSIGFVASTGVPIVLNNFTINAGFVSASTLGTTFISGANNVILPTSSYTATTGTGNLDFSVNTPLVWDGVSNLLVETCFNNNNAGGSSTNSISVQSSTVASGLNVYYTADSNATVCSSLIVTSSTIRPNLRITAQQSTLITWSPVTNLYMDAAATVAYTAGTFATTVYFKSATAGVNNYTVTGTTTTNCGTSATAAITAVDCSIAYVNLQFPGNTSIVTCESQTFYAQVFKAGVTEDPGQGAGMEAWIGRSTTNTNPATWTEASWQPATFNVQAGNNDEYQATFGPSLAGTYYVASRFKFAPGAFVYGGFTSSGGGIWNASTNVSAVMIVSAIPAPTGAPVQNFTTGQTLANLTVAGSNITWYSAPTGGVVLPSTTLLVSGTTYYASQTINSCESTIRLAINAGVDLKNSQFESTNLRYYPNPVEDFLTVDYSETIEGIQMYNMLGQLVYERNTNTSTVLIDMSSMASGNYILKLSINGSSKNVKVIKK